MKPTFIYIFTLCASLILGCSSNDIEFSVAAHDKYNLQEEAKIQYRGMEIGRVEKIERLDDSHFIYHCSLQPEIQVPKDSKFQIKAIDVFGKQILDVEFGKHKEFLKAKDQVSLNTKEELFQVQNDPILNDWVEKLSSIADEIKAVTLESHSEKDSLLLTDSLVYELRRLNDNLERLNKIAQ